MTVEFSLPRQSLWEACHGSRVRCCIVRTTRSRPLPSSMQVTTVTSWWLWATLLTLLAAKPRRNTTSRTPVRGPRAGLGWAAVGMYQRSDRMARSSSACMYSMRACARFPLLIQKCFLHANIDTHSMATPRILLFHVNSSKVIHVRGTMQGHACVLKWLVC